MQIYISPYQKNWPVLFEIEQQKILANSSNIIAAVEHIGSTAVVGLPAKPIIDILVGLHNFEQDAAKLVQDMIAADYFYNDKYEHLMPYRRFFQAKELAAQKCNIHCVQINGEFWNRHIMFRNYLRQHDEKRDAYCQHKIELAQRDWVDTADYAGAKTAFIRNMEAEAKLFLK
ncbi:MAG: GrpB family protein [Chitinophagales bacterium]